MPWVVDGNNAAGGSGRERVRSAALALARGERLKLVVFFDGAPPQGSPEVEHLGSVEVRYVRNADAAILAAIASKGRAWKVVTDDRAVADRARGRGAEVVKVDAFWRRVAAVEARSTDQGGSVDLTSELAYFRDSSNRLNADQGGRVKRESRSRKAQSGRER